MLTIIISICISSYLCIVLCWGLTVDHARIKNIQYTVYCIHWLAQHSASHPQFNFCLHHQFLSFTTFPVIRLPAHTHAAGIYIYQYVCTDVSPSLHSPTLKDEYDIGAHTALYIWLLHYTVRNFSWLFGVINICIPEGAKPTDIQSWKFNSLYN